MKIEALANEFVDTRTPYVLGEFIAAVRGADYPLVMMIALFSVSAMLIASLIVDILTALIDPRVRLGES